MLSHPLGRQWLNKQLHEKDPEMVPHPLPDQAQLAALIADLPLRIVQYVDEDTLYMVLLQVSRHCYCGNAFWLCMKEGCQMAKDWCLELEVFCVSFGVGYSICRELYAIMHFSAAAWGKGQRMCLVTKMPCVAKNSCQKMSRKYSCAQVPENYMMQRSSVQLHGDVTSGFGRGSKQLGFPTANLPPKPLEKELHTLPKGVYFG